MNDDLTTLDADTIGIDFRANTLTVSASIPAEDVTFLTGQLAGTPVATIDIGTRGRLLGLELGAAKNGSLLAVAIADATPQDVSVLRSARIPATVSFQPSRFCGARATMEIVFSRHGDDYDISWPSGNQCWRRTTVGPDGTPRVTCAVVEVAAVSATD